MRGVGRGNLTSRGTRRRSWRSMRRVRRGNLTSRGTRRRVGRKGGGLMRRVRERERLASRERRMRGERWGRRRGKQRDGAKRR